MPLFGHKNKSKIIELGRYWMPFCSDAGMTTFNSQIVELVIVGYMQQTCIAKAGIIFQTKWDAFMEDKLRSFSLNRRTSSPLVNWNVWTAMKVVQ